MKVQSRKTIFRISVLLAFTLVVSASLMFIFAGNNNSLETRLANMNVTTITTTVSGARTVTNGNALVITGAGRVTGNITVNAGGLLVVEGNGSPFSGNGYRAIQGRVTLMGGDFYMLSGGLWNPGTTAAVTVDRGGNFTMRGGIIRNSSTTPMATASTATFAVDVIHGHYLLEDGMVVVGGANISMMGNNLGVRLNQGGNGHFTMNGGTLFAPGVSPNTISVAINAGVFTMNGGAIRGGTNRLNSVTGVTMRGIGSNQAHFIMNGGDIYQQSRGVDMEGHNAVFTLNDGQVRDNRGGSGTGVSLSREATFIMHGGAVSNNTTSDVAAGVRVSGNGTIFTMYNGSINHNRVISPGSAINGGNGVVGGVSSRAGGVLVTNSGHFYMYGGYIEYNAAGVGGGVLISSSATMSMVATVQHHSYMKLDGGTIRNNEAVYGRKDHGGGGVKVYSAVTAAIPGRALTSSSTFDMYSGYIIGNVASSRGGARGSGPSGVANIWGVSGGGVSVTTNDGAASGGVLRPNAIFNMHGGTIANNRATSTSGDQYVMGGGVYASVRGAVINMYGGVMEGNSAAAGGAVGLNQGAVFNMHDGIIRHNEAHGVRLRDWPSNIIPWRERDLVVRGGGGVYLHDHGRYIFTSISPRFNMYGGYIVENTSMDGGGIFWMCISHDSAWHHATGTRTQENSLTRVYISENAVVQYNTATRGARIDDELWGRHRAEDPTVDWGGNVVTRSFTSTGGTYRHLFNNHDIRTRGGEAPDPEPTPTPTPGPVYDVTFVNTPQGYLNGAHGANVYLQLDYNETVTADMVPNADGIHGWEFTGWTYDAAGNFPADPAGHVVTGDINFYAHFQRVYFRVTFVAGENGVIVGDEYIYVLFEDMLTYDMLPETEPDEHFVLSGWDPDPMHGVIVTGDMTIYASFVRLRITIRFEANPEYGGFLGQGQPYMMLSYLDGDVIVPPVATPQWGFEFVGWTPDPTGYIVTPSSHGSIFIAEFAPIGHGGRDAYDGTDGYNRYYGGNYYSYNY